MSWAWLVGGGVNLCIDLLIGKLIEYGVEYSKVRVTFGAGNCELKFPGLKKFDFNHNLFGI